MNSRSLDLPVQLARRVSRRFAQCTVTAAAGFVMVSLIGCGIVRQSFERIAAKTAVLAEIGVEPLVDPSHFLGRSFIQNLMAGSFFGITIGLAAGIMIFFACVLVESLPYRKLRAACMVILCLLLAYLSHRVFLIVPGAWGLLVWLFPASAAAVCEAASPTPIWRSFFPPSGSDAEDTPGAGRKAPLLIVLFNVAAAAAVILWAVQSAPIIRHGAASRNFFVYFRDDILLGTAPGRALDRFYYRHSPYAAEYIPLTQFQPVIIATVGLDNDTSGFIPRHYGNSMFSIYTISMPDLDTAADRFTSGNFNIMVLQPSSLGITPEEAEELLEKRSDLPDNWRARCVIITDRRKRSKTAVPSAVRRAIFDMIATGPSEPVRNLLGFCFVRPLLRIFKRPLFPTGFLIVVLWLCILIAAGSARGTSWPAVSVVVSALFAAVLWWIVIAGGPERAVLADILIRFDDRMPSDREMDELLSSKSAEVRYASLRYLAERSDTARVGRALELFADSDPRVRMRAVHFVGKALKRSRSHPLRGRALSRIVNALYDESFHVRYTAAEAAASAGLHEVEPELLDLIRKNEHLYVTWYAVNALRKLRSSPQSPPPSGGEEGKGVER